MRKTYTSKRHIFNPRVKRILYMGRGWVPSPKMGLCHTPLSPTPLLYTQIYKLGFRFCG